MQNVVECGDLLQEAGFASDHEPPLESPKRVDVPRENHGITIIERVHERELLVRGVLLQRPHVEPEPDLRERIERKAQEQVLGHTQKFTEHNTHGHRKKKLGPSSHFHPNIQYIYVCI